MKGRIISSIIFDERLNYPYVIATSEERNNSNLGNAHGWLTYSVRYNNQESYDLFLDILDNHFDEIKEIQEKYTGIDDEDFK